MNNNFEEHTREKGYIGVTSFISTFFKLFDAERIAFFVAKAQGKTKEEVLKEWEALQLALQHKLLYPESQEAEQHKARLAQMKTAFKEKYPKFIATQL